ncbi:hypothetical protein JYT97_01620 [Haliea sp. AH-315-K21]|uniref:Uncharacterized protein n=1 Tax=SAR86 cluster bacterium TaxID=2030880 RepID=A0A2A5C927_9GAMM|nr:hypothetical protein [Haliea sp. AH-315-K21]MBN4075696.1 hypothetical protein [Gammaproteobacteria bacterium AH-315-E17]PCJ39971.1 MAG: hypothetical protein COA71_12415 [SAR86 cluster bacterium]
MNNSDIEKKLNKINLTKPSNNYVEKAQGLLKAPSTHSIWQKRLNYALGLCLVISVGINLVQVMSQKKSLQVFSSNCQTNRMGNDFQPSEIHQIAVLVKTGYQLNTNFQPLAC